MKLSPKKDDKHLLIFPAKNVSIQNEIGSYLDMKNVMKANAIRQEWYSCKHEPLDRHRFSRIVTLEPT